MGHRINSADESRYSQGAVNGDPDINTEWNFIVEMAYIDLWEHPPTFCRTENVEQFFL